jgi:signal transduction histidine kinase
VAGVIALSTGRRVTEVWRTDFLWSAASFMVAATAGAIAAVIVARGEHWKAALMIAPVYLTYRSYQLFVGRIEDQRQHQLAIAEARDRAEHASQLKDQFLALVSHELRTPLNAILGWADMLRHGRLADAQRERACKAIYDSARRQAQLIDELLDVARIMSGKLHVERSLVNLNDVARGALEIVQPTADAKQVRIVIETEPDIGAIVGDAARLQQIAWNLLSNSVKFTPAGGTVRFRARRIDEHSVELSVADNGEGIPREFLPAVFEPFRQADGSTTRPHGGLGLGLSIVKHLVEAHGGTVRAESDGPGCGATFTVTLPLATHSEAVGSAAAVVAAELTEGAARIAPGRASLGGLAVLVVDDDEQSRDVVAAHLEQNGAKVFTAESAGRAYELLQRERVDVLLADVAMPGEDGYTLLRRVRTINGSTIASIPAVALTAFAREEDKQQALRAGFQLHLPKPVDPRALLAAVASLSRVPVT